MVDITDIASEREEELLAEAMARHARTWVPTGAGLLFCEDCDAPIPARRREALPGCTTCVECQEVREWRR